MSTTAAAQKPVCLVLAADARIGSRVARRFAREGGHACLARRTDRPGLDRPIGGVEAEGGSAGGWLVQMVEDGSVERLVRQTGTNCGPIEVAVFNLGTQIGDRPLADASL